MWRRCNSNEVAFVSLCAFVHLGPFSSLILCEPCILEGVWLGDIIISSYLSCCTFLSSVYFLAFIVHYALVLEAWIEGIREGYNIWNFRAVD